MSDELTLTVGGEMAAIDDGNYEATLVGLDPFTINTDEGEKTLLRWTFALEEMDGNVTVEGVSSMAMGPKAKAYRWLGALLGAERMVKGVQLRKGELLGRACMVSVVQDKNGYPKAGEVTARPKRRAAA